MTVIFLLANHAYLDGADHKPNWLMLNLFYCYL